MQEVENVDKQGIKATRKGKNAPAELQDIAVKLAALAQQIKSIAAAPLGEAVAEHAEVPPTVALE
ncbi:hypothetical protein [Ensifer sp. 4252]|uniref:hypothetical protein n=1 Tax=Ensifer sp. 4252 TaxID=3373915 RepID=UPI003D217A67